MSQTTSPSKIKVECFAGLHTQCPDTVEDLAECECFCHLLASIACPECGEAPDYFWVISKDSRGYSVRGISDKVVTINGDSAWDEQIDELDTGFQCPNSHEWYDADAEIDWA